ncbi:MAG: hypothetical protein HY961_18000 [Ignavibacteriae bacterium]|nr:hypothetical protein [Ignavibacteriota bacterium]
MKENVAYARKFCKLNHGTLAFKLNNAFFTIDHIHIIILCMNQPSTFTGPETKNSRSYDEVRSQIRNGDVLMYKGRSLASRIIMFATRSRYSHAGLAIWWNSRLMTMEAVGKGVIVQPLSRSVDHYDGRVTLFASRENISDEDRLRLVMFAQEELGKEYGTWKAIRLGLKILFQKDREKRDKLRRERQLFCSYYVAQAYNAIGKDLKKETSDRFMTPGDVAESPSLQKIAVLRKRR